MMDLMVRMILEIEMNLVFILYHLWMDFYVQLINLIYLAPLNLMGTST